MPIILDLVILLKRTKERRKEKRGSEKKGNTILRSIIRRAAKIEEKKQRGPTQTQIIHVVYSYCRLPLHPRPARVPLGEICLLSAVPSNNVDVMMGFLLGKTRGILLLYISTSSVPYK